MMMHLLFHFDWDGMTKRQRGKYVVLDAVCKKRVRFIINERNKTALGSFSQH